MDPILPLPLPLTEIHDRAPLRDDSTAAILTPADPSNALPCPVRWGRAPPGRLPHLNPRLTIRREPCSAGPILRLIALKQNRAD